MNADALPLVLGGHSFISELGNDAPTDESAQRDIVAACLDAGITWFDTTYEPERIGLGRALDTLGRRAEATVIAWNFFLNDKGEHLVRPRAYRPGDLALMQDQLRADRIDMLVVHAVGDEAEDARQVDLAREWEASGRVGRLGIWGPSADAAEAEPYAFMVAPRNVANPNDAVFSRARELGWETLATSPFDRGWLLDNLAETAAGEGTVERVASAMLRFALHDPRVDRVVVAIRRVEWVERNVRACHSGPLDVAERDWLEGLARRGK